MSMFAKTPRSIPFLSASVDLLDKSYWMYSRATHRYPSFRVYRLGLEFVGFILVYTRHSVAGRSSWSFPGRV
ncbi:hypothetical protein OG21DRAFT_1022947 [Imleria badia]|nr:hypothetical protein OG21DRAFT_1022947 [Imleria badia]